MISVCMGTHNGEKYVKEQILSILCQLTQQDELIISDDGSTDNTIDIINSLKDKRIKIFYQKSPKGLPNHEYTTKNFENALKQAKGDYIFLSDQDDVWVKNKVEIMLNYLQKYYYVVSDCFVTDKNLDIVSNTRFIKSENIHFNKYLALILSTPYQGSCAAFRKEVLDLALPFPKGLQSHDRWIGDIASFFFNVGFAKEKLIYYRRHDSTVSNTFGQSNKRSFFKTLIYKWIYVKGILNLKVKLWVSNKK